MMNASGLILAPLGALYSAAMRARLALYRSGALRIHKIGSPVISVGNITTGGTGKTPLVEYIARAAAKKGRRVCILTRGYGRADARGRVLVSDGKQILADALAGGDEPRLLAEMLQGVAAIISDADRLGAARWAEENLGSDVFILDDGFQHLRLARDLDLVTVDATNPWGGGRLLPHGRLRERLKGLARADCIILTRAEQSQDIGSLRKEAERLSDGRPVLISRTCTKAICPLDEMIMNGVASELSTHHSSLITHHSLPQPVAAFCAVGNPAAFFAHARNDGHTLSYTRAFHDHHIYQQTDVDALVSEAKRAGVRALLTTAKDAVKLRSLRFDLPCYVLEIGLEFDDEETLTGMIRQAIEKRPA
ncbi:MAG: tetraacyldisaccharide 4-kinase [Acidobacteriota bacterium]|jgi:tetraacyldisaccharide 4'-kinase|nr:tetraacyldisaccharide 4-kinase [Acidobacteriota bacterium]